MPSGETALCDSGPLVALFDPSDVAHAECRDGFKAFRGHLTTTWPVLTEVFHFLESEARRQSVWDFVMNGGLSIAEIMREELPRMRGLMAKYADLPMDLADASLVVLSERLKVREIFTLDRRDFRLYRPRYVRSFHIFP